MAVYNFPTQFLRIKFGSDTVKVYIPTAKRHITAYTQLNLETLGTKALNGYVSGVTSFIPSTTNVYRPATLVTDAESMKNVTYQSGWANRYNWDKYDYSNAYSLLGLTLDRQFFNVVMELGGMWSTNIDTNLKTVNGQVLNANGNPVCNCKVEMQWIAESPNVTIFAQSLTPPIINNSPTINQIYFLRMRFYPNIDDYPAYGTNEPMIYNDDKNTICWLSFAGIEYSNKLFVPENRKERFIETRLSKLTDVSNIYYPLGSGEYIYEAQISNPSTGVGMTNTKIKGALQFTGSPYEGNGNNGAQETSGSYDGSTESVTEDTLPSDNVLSSGLLRAYLPEDTELTSLHSYLFSSGFVDNIIKALKCPFDTIVKLHSLPISISGYADTIHLGNLDSSIACDRTISRYIDVNLGNIKIEGYYGLFNDYTSKYDLYLPYLNVVSLPSDEVINATISINYRVDILTGDFVCTVSSTKTNAKGYPYTAIIYSAGGNMASDIPISQSNSLGMIGALNSGLNTAISKPTDIGGSFQTGVAIGVGGSVSYGTKGSLSSNSGKLGKRYPYFRETIPNVILPTDYSKLVGFRSEMTDTISNFSGFCKFRDFELDFGTVEEQNEIRQILRNGIYVEGTPSITTTHDIVLLNNTSDDRTLGKTVVAVDEIDGDFKDFVNLHNIDIDIDITGLSIGSINYMYIPTLGRYYFVRQKTMLNNSICRFSLVCDLLESMATDILSVRAICERAESGYYTNPMLTDSEIPVQVNNIIKYHNFSAGLDNNTNVLICI